MQTIKITGPQDVLNCREFVRLLVQSHPDFVPSNLLGVGRWLDVLPIGNDPVIRSAATEARHELHASKHPFAEQIIWIMDTIEKFMESLNINVQDGDELVYMGPFMPCKNELYPIAGYPKGKFNLYI